jgi:NodT family efflux transporter outer membrane factor (OMF) lipoprotein
MKNFIKHNLASSLFFALLLLAVACKSPEQVQQNLQVPAPAFRNDTAANVDTTTSTSIAQLPWKQFLANTELATLIDTALRKNTDLQIAVKNIEASDLLLKKAKWGLVPQVGLVVNSSNSIPSRNSLTGLTASQFLGTSDLNNYMATLGVSWEADIWGKIKNQKREAFAQYLQTQEARKAVQTTLVAAIATGYYNLLMLDEQLAIARRNLALGDSTLLIMKQQYAVGQLTTLAIEQAAAQRLIAAGLIPQLDERINQQENALSVLIGIPPQAITRQRSLQSLNLPPIIRTGLPDEMISFRPDVKSRELELQIANAHIGLARANMYPSLVISAQGGINSLKTSNWFNIPASLFGMVAGSLAQPILQKRTLRTEYEVAIIKREQAVLAFRGVVLTAYQEVADVLTSIEQLEKRQGFAAERVDKLMKATGDAGKLFSSGMANYLEVITAQSNALSGELELASIRHRQITAVIDLYRALGGGWN